MNRHLTLMGPGSRVVYNSDTIEPGEAAEGVQLCPLPIAELTDNNRNKLVQNTVALGAVTFLLRLGFDVLEASLTAQFQRKGQDVVDENVAMARAGFDYTSSNFEPLPRPSSRQPKPFGCLDRQRGLSDGWGRGGREVLLCVPHESCDRGSPLDGEERPRPRHHGPPNRGTKSASPTWPSEPPTQARGRCARPPAAALR